MTEAAHRPPEYHWLLPTELREPVERVRSGRSSRDWTVDSLCFVVALSWALLSGIDLVQSSPRILVQWAGTPAWLAWADLAAGVALVTALWWRRRFPVQLALLAVPLAASSRASAVASMIMFFTVAVHRRFATTGVIGVGALAANAAFCVLRPEACTSLAEALAWSTVFLVITLLWGMVVRSRRQLVMSLRERAERAESEQYLRVTQARAMERTRIAREMHDVLAHRISLLSLHAGALEIHPGAAPAEVAGAAGVIRASAHQALQDLREVIGVLREPAGDDTPERPQPTVGELPALVEQSRDAGERVELQLAAAGVPAGVGRHAYRIVQEALTNARKHAPGTAVRVSVAGTPGTGLTVTVRNPAPLGSPPPATLPGTGTGLIGLAERATLAGGRLTSGRGVGGEFTLTAWLPWPVAGAAP